MQMRTLSLKDHVGSENEIAHSYPPLGPHPSQCGAPDDRLSAMNAIHRARTVRHVGASHTCSVHAHVPLYRNHLLLLLLPCPHAARRRIARPTPGSLLSIRSRCPRQDIFFLLRCSFFEMGTLAMGRDVLAICFANYDRVRKKTWHFIYPGCESCLFCSETEIFFSFSRGRNFLIFRYFWQIVHIHPRIICCLFFQHINIF